MIRISFSSGERITLISCKRTLGSKLYTALLIASLMPSSSNSVSSENKNRFKLPPKNGLNGFSVWFVNNKFLIACLTEAASVFLKSYPVVLFLKERSISL